MTSTCERSSARKPQCQCRIRPEELPGVAEAYVLARRYDTRLLLDESGVIDAGADPQVLAQMMADQIC